MTIKEDVACLVKLVEALQKKCKKYDLEVIRPDICGLDVLVQRVKTWLD